MATLPINNPKRILGTLDSYLERETRIILFGRAALTLGFGDFGGKFGATQDVDAILPTVEMTRIESDIQFWEAVDKTNRELEPTGLYVSHLFTDRQVVLTERWLEKIVEIPSGEYKYLRLFRPSSIDLILTKMMRNDREDLGDIRFILERDRIGADMLEEAFKNSCKVEVSELQESFLKMQPLVRKMALAVENGRSIGGVAEPAGYTLDPDWWAKLTDEFRHQKGREKDRDLSL